MKKVYLTSFIIFSLLFSSLGYSQLFKSCETKFYVTSTTLPQFFNLLTQEDTIIDGPPNGNWVTFDIELQDKISQDALRINMSSDGYSALKGASPPQSVRFTGKNTLHYEFYRAKDYTNPFSNFYFVINPIDKSYGEPNVVIVKKCNYTNFGKNQNLSKR